MPDVVDQCKMDFMSLWAFCFGIFFVLLIFLLKFFFLRKRERADKQASIKLAK